MPIPIEKGVNAKRDREIKRLQRQKTETTKRVRRLLLVALHYAKEAEAGVKGADAERDAWLEAAFDAGLAKDALKGGNAMVARINTVLDRPDAQSHALGLLLAAADLIAEFDAGKAAEVQTIADTLNTSGDHERWRGIVNPYRQPPII